MSMETLKKSRRSLVSNDPHDPYTEVWDGVTVVSPSANNEHSTLSILLASPLVATVDWTVGDWVGAVPNISDRNLGWEKNYRIPDIAVVLGANPTVDHDTHWEGGPDFLVEIISPGEDPHSKLPFYEKINTREVLIVHHDPWKLELFQHNGIAFDPPTTSNVAMPQQLVSRVLTLTFQLVQGTNRAEIVVTHTHTQQQWIA